MNGECGPLLISLTQGSEMVTAERGGAKAADLWQMARLGLNVPPAFVLPTTLCAGVNAGDPGSIDTLGRSLTKGIAWLEQTTGRRFGDSRAPLLVSVRSGAARSMPGMLKTVLNIGLNDDAVHGLIRMTGNPRLGFDSYRRLIRDFAEVVDAVPAAEFDQCLRETMDQHGITLETQLDPEALERLSQEYRDRAAHAAGRSVPKDPREQLEMAARAIYASWESERAREYRKLNNLESLNGTAVTVQAMVFGNSGPTSGAGVAFSRNPASGAKEIYLDFLFDAQGEDVVSGRRTPGNAARLEARLPEVAGRLAEGMRQLEAAKCDAQDVEFTVEAGCLYFLQTRTAKRSSRAALRIAIDMVQEGLIDKTTALTRLSDLDPAALTIARFADEAPIAATAVAAAPGVASGRAAFDAIRAKELAVSGDPVILIRRDISTDDFAGLAASAGMLTAIGGRTAHAAVIARQLGKVCIVGCNELVIDQPKRRATLGSHSLAEGDWLSLDGDTGEVSLGKRDIVTEPPSELREIERWRTP